MSNGNAGPSYLNANNSLSNSNSNNGARLAFGPQDHRSCKTITIQSAHDLGPRRNRPCTKRFSTERERTLKAQRRIK
nr:MAG TPA: hypothetical protein [Caudoviricetes sp.]